MGTGDKIDKRSVVPLKRQLAAELRRRIEGGETWLPGERRLARQYGVSVGTVREALKILRDEGLVETWRGRGTGVPPGRGS
jgi:DNA-binding GntR family transcriptional regulator